MAAVSPTDRRSLRPSGPKGPWKDPMNLGVWDENGGRDDDEMSIESYTIGGRCLATHAKCVDEEAIGDFDDEECSESQDGQPLQDRDLESLEPLPPNDELPAAVTVADEEDPYYYDEGIDGEPCT